MKSWSIYIDLHPHHPLPSSLHALLTLFRGSARDLLNRLSCSCRRLLCPLLCRSEEFCLLLPCTFLLHPEIVSRRSGSFRPANYPLPRCCYPDARDRIVGMLRCWNKCAPRNFAPERSSRPCQESLWSRTETLTRSCIFASHLCRAGSLHWCVSAKGKSCRRHALGG